MGKQVKKSRTTRHCKGCKTEVPLRSIACEHCQTPSWDLLGGTFAEKHAAFEGEVDNSVIFPLIDEIKEAYKGGAASTIHREIDVGNKKLKVRVRNTFVVFRDNPRCVACGEMGVKWFVVTRNKHKPLRGCNLIFLTAKYVPLTIDHTIPRSKGGLNSLSNFQTMCWDCNNRKGKMSWDDFMRVRASMTDSQRQLLEDNGWEVECESPREIRHKETGSFCSLLGVDALIESLEREQAHEKTVLPATKYPWIVQFLRDQPNDSERTKLRFLLQYLMLIDKLDEFNSHAAEHYRFAQIPSEQDALLVDLKGQSDENQTEAAD